MQSRINSYLRAAAPQGRQARQVGPFLATCNPATDNPYLNYAIPDDDADPTPADVAALVVWYLDRNRKPRLEYVSEAAPAVEPALIKAGFTVEGRLAVMTFEAAGAPGVPDPAEVELVAPASDDELFGMMLVQAEAYASPRPPSRDEIPRRRAALDGGAIAIIARDLVTRAVVGAGSCSAIVDGLTEVAAIGVAMSYRRRGIARSLAQRLANEALQRGAELPFLMAAGQAEQRIYRRAGFTDVGQILHISR